MGSKDADEDEFRGFVTARWHALVRMAYLLTGDHGLAEDLVQAALEKVHRRWRMTWLDGNDSGGTAVIIAPRGARVELADKVRFGADGRANRTWRTVPAPDGVAARALPGSQSTSLLVARVTLKGARIFEGPLMGGWASDGAPPPSPVSEAMITAATRATRGAPVDRALVHDRVRDILNSNGLAGTEVTVRVPWSGRIAGKPAILVTVQPRGGGVLAYAFHGTPEESREDMRLLLPARDAERRPLAWRMRAENGDDPTGSVVVVAPPGPPPPSWSRTATPSRSRSTRRAAAPLG